MKKILLLSIMTMLCCLRMMGQATDLVIDNQTPGWLSSKINYGDQLTVKNLKVTGYINKTDLQFIGTLIDNNLHGVIDLGEVFVVGNEMDRWLFHDTNSYMEELNYIQKLILPPNVEKLNDHSYLSETRGFNEKIDTLIFDLNMKTIGSRYISEVKHLYMGDKIENLASHSIYSWNTFPLETIVFSPNIKVISEYAIFGFDNTIDLSASSNYTFPSLESIGRQAFNINVIWPDTVSMPRIENFDESAFRYKKGMHIYFGDRLKTVNNRADPDEYKPNFTGVNFHLKGLASFSIDFRNTANVWVPKELVEKFKSNGYKNVFAEPVPVQEISINKHDIVMEVGDKLQLNAKIVPYNADDQTIVWKVTDDNIIKVSDNGLVEALSSGKAKVIAYSSDENIFDECMVTVAAHADSVSINPTTLLFNSIGETAQLEAIIYPENAIDKSVTWKSSNDGVCTVNNNGVVLATGPGETIVTATTNDGGHMANCIVKVLRHVDNLSIEISELSLYVGEEKWIKATLNPVNSDNKTILWSSSNDEIVTVDDNGNIKAKKAGNAYITAISEDNNEAKDSCLVHVLQSVNGISLNISSFEFNALGESVELEATIYPEDATNKDVIWKSSDESVCIVSNGKVVAVGYGICIIMANTVDGNYMASCTITVNNSSGIDSIDNYKTTYNLYDSNGRKLNDFTKGLNIIYLPNGTVRKITIK